MWGAQFVIDNRGGAGGTIAAAAVAKAERDGYTLMYDATAHSVNPSLYPSLPYDTVKDFQPVFLAALVTNLLVVNKAVEAKTVADVIALAKATPGGLDWASSGNGTVQHLALEMFRYRAGIKLNHIPYRGGGLVLNDLIGGQVKFYFSERRRLDRSRAIRHAQMPRAYRPRPARDLARRAGGGGDAARFRGLRVARRVRAVGHAGRHHRQAQCRLERGDPAAGHRPARLAQLNVETRANTPEEFRAFVAAEMEENGAASCARPTSSSVDKSAALGACARVARCPRGQNLSCAVPTRRRHGKRSPIVPGTGFAHPANSRRPTAARSPWWRPARGRAGPRPAR